MTLTRSGHPDLHRRRGGTGRLLRRWRAGHGGAARPPLDVAVDSERNLFLVDSRNGRIRDVGGGEVIATVFHGGSTRDGAAHYYPARVAVDTAGNLLIADPFQHRVILEPARPLTLAPASDAAPDSETLSSGS